MPLRFHLLHDYCPACFRPSTKKMCFTEICLDDPRLDRLQGYYAIKARNGMRLYDLARPGPLCANHCAMLCLVCGKPVIHKDDPDFDLASTHQAAFHRHNSVRDSDPGLELAHQSALRRVAARNGARLTSRWSSLVHAHCAERASGCGCWLPRGASGCLVHAGQTEKKERKTAWSRMLESDTEEEEMSSGEWSGLMAKMKPDAPKGALKPAKPKKVEPPAKNVEAPAKPAPGAWYDLMDKMKTDAPASALRKKAATAPRVISEAEASKEEWLASQVIPTRHGNFDIRFHGYFMSRERGLFYRFPDGRELPATGVDAFE